MKRIPKVDRPDMPSPARKLSVDADDLASLSTVDAGLLTMAELTRVLEHHKVAKVSACTKPQLVWLFEVLMQGRVMQVPPPKDGSPISKAKKDAVASP
jgi:hypothetical protein